MNLDKFVAENCGLCGSQRCDPYNPEWLQGCSIYQSLKENKIMREPKYKFFSDGANKIVAVSSYAGKSVRGVAKCDPRDSFDEKTGQSLAQARCNMKVAEKRYSRAMKEHEKAYSQLCAAQARFDKMEAYLADAADARNIAEQDLKMINAGL